MAVFSHTRSTALWIALLAQPLWSQSWVQGTVYERIGQTVRPLARAFVSVSTPGGETLGVVRTDDQGRYRFLDLPQGRLTLAASKPGYVTRQAAGRAGASATLDCAAGCRESGLDFELSSGAVVAGVALDAGREPVSRAAVLLRREGAAASGEKPSTASTDDRGRFRIAGLPAGSYTLTVQRRGPAGRNDVVTKTLEIREAEQVTGLTLTFGGEGAFRVAGRVSGIPYGEGYRTWVSIQPVNGSGPGIQANVDSDGRFRFESVPAGRYRAAAAVVKLGAGERADHFLETIEVLGDTDSLTLQRVEPATVTGTVEVAAGALPAGAVIRFLSRDGSVQNWTRVAGGRVFELGGLSPGVYRVEPGAPKFYIKGVKAGGELQPAAEVVLAPGQNRLTVLVAADLGQVFGTVRDPQTRRPLPHARVALRGSSEAYSVQADQTGRFLFGTVVPGDYRICAWKNLAPEEVENAEIWRRSGCESRIIPIAPSSENEIDLRAAP